MSEFMDRFEKWEREPPPDLYGDPIWRLPAYRIALFMARVARADVVAMIRVGAPVHTTSQLEHSVNSIGANIAEGYTRFSGRERARYFEVALGSAREAREWYRCSESWLGTEPAQERGMLLTRAIKILTVAVPQERAGASERRISRANQWREKGETET